MIRRALVALVLAWVLGLAAFVQFLPGPAGNVKTDAIVVPTGGGGRIERGLDELERGNAKALLVSGVGQLVKPAEFAAEYHVPARLMACCVTLGFSALNTKGNAEETVSWIRVHRFRTLRLVTSDWHMRRAQLELRAMLPPGVKVVEDAVPTNPKLRTLLLEYNKLLASFVSQLIPG